MNLLLKFINGLLTTKAFYAKKVSQTSPQRSALHTPWCHFISGLWLVSLAEYILVLRVLFTLVADDVVYHGYCANCHNPAADDE